MIAFQSPFTFYFKYYLLSVFSTFEENLLSYLKVSATCDDGAEKKTRKV